MLSGLYQFYRKHRKGLMIAAGLVTAGYFLISYINQKRLEFQQDQERILKENEIRQRIKLKYEQTQRDCTVTILGFLQELSDSLYFLFPIEDITKQLVSKKKQNLLLLNDPYTPSSVTTTTNNNSNNKDAGDPIPTKKELWNELKLKSLTKLLTLIYGITLLTLLVKLQINILARDAYIESALEAAGIDKNPLEGENDESNKYVINESYLSLTWWFLNHGYLKIYEICEDAVKLVFKDVSAKSELSFNEFSSLISKTQELIDKNFINDDNHEFLFNCLLPPSNLEPLIISKRYSSSELNSSLDIEEFLALDIEQQERINKIVNNQEFRILVNETKDYVQGEIISIVQLSIITTLIGKFLNDCAANLFDDNNKDTNEQNDNADDFDIQLLTKKFKLVKILMVVNKESANLSESSNRNQYIKELKSVNELEDYAASVYSEFDI